MLLLVPFSALCFRLIAAIERKSQTVNGIFMTIAKAIHVAHVQLHSKFDAIHFINRVTQKEEKKRNEFAHCFVIYAYKLA